MENNSNTENNIDFVSLVNEIKLIIIETSENLINTNKNQSTPIQSEESKTKEELDEIILQQSSVLSSIESRIKNLEEKVNDFTYKDDIINRLHDELQKYKSGLRKEFVTPLLKGIIREYDRSIRMYNHYFQEEEANSEGKYFNLLKQFEITSDGLLELLNDYDIESFSVKPGEKFSAKDHRLIQITEVEDPSKDNIIETVVSCGFLDNSNGKILRNPEVNIYKSKIN
jgi:molecular chaperone GrpE (heat shock protein)